MLGLDNFLQMTRYPRFVFHRFVLLHSHRIIMKDAGDKVLIHNYNGGVTTTHDDQRCSDGLKVSVRDLFCYRR